MIFALKIKMKNLGDFDPRFVFQARCFYYENIKF